MSKKEKIMGCWIPAGACLVGVLASVFSKEFRNFIGKIWNIIPFTNLYFLSSILLLTAVILQRNKAKSQLNNMGCSDQCDCLNEGLVKINRNCLPDLDPNILRKPLTPSMPFENVDPEGYSNSFAKALANFTNSSGVWDKAIKSNISDNTLNDKVLPRIFLVCEYKPIQIVENLFRDALSFTSFNKRDENKIKNLLLELGYKDLPQAMMGGWRTEDEGGKDQIEKMVEMSEIIYPHFKFTNLAILQLERAIQGILRNLPTDESNELEPQLNKYYQKAVVRVLLWNEESKLFPKKTRKPTFKDSSSRQAFNFFAKLNDKVTCYVAAVNDIAKRISPEQTFPFTDYAIIDRGNCIKQSKIEIWDFYSGSQILLIYGRNKNGDHRSTSCSLPVKCETSYEVLMKDWDNYYGDEKKGYYTLEKVPSLDRFS